MPRNTLATIVSALHLVSAAYLIAGWSLPWTWALWFAVIVYPLVLIQWRMLDNRCGLTILEERLRSEPDAPLLAVDPEAPQFASRLLGRVLGRPVSRFWGDVVSYSIVAGGWAIASLRLAARYD